MMVNRSVPSRPPLAVDPEAQTKLFNATQHLVFHVPAAKLLQPNRLREQPLPLPAPILSLPYTASADDALILPCLFVEVATHPFPIASLPKKLSDTEDPIILVDKFMSQIDTIYDEEQRDIVDHR